MKLLNSLILTGCLLTGCISAQGYGSPSNSTNQTPQGPFRIIIFENGQDNDSDEDLDDQSEGAQTSQNQRGWGNSGRQGSSGWDRWDKMDQEQGLWGQGFGRGGDQANYAKICQAIQSQSRIQAIVKTKEVVSAKEMKITVKAVTVEPYAFGMTQDGTPLLKGNVVDEKNLKDISVKVYEDMFDDKEKQPEWNKKGWFGDKSVRILDVRDIKALQVVPNERFDTPKNFKGFDEKGLQVNPVCSIQGDDQGLRNGPPAPPKPPRPDNR